MPKLICRIVILVWLGATAMDAESAPPEAVATFHSIGLAWNPDNESPEPGCEVKYRPVAQTNWKTGFPLWYDPRRKEFRGSLVHLEPGTEYEIELKQSGTEEIAQLRATTWAESFPLGDQIELPEQSTETLRVDRSGTPAAYTIYRPAVGKKAEIDVDHREEACIRVRASHVILRGLTLRRAAVHGIILEDGVHDVIIEGCEITNWGRIAADGWAESPDAAIFSRSPTVERIIIQGNRIHHPAGDANSWAELRPTSRDPNNHHPGGAQVIYLAESAGNHVFRYNSVWSDDDHQFNDIFGARANYSRNGFPNRDSDIYGNYLSHCWDDAIESEGANRNVRIWGNYLTECFVGVATATTSIGPLYVWRNVVGVSRKSFEKENAQGAFMKHSDRMGGGRIFVFHNTLLQPPKLTVRDGGAGCGTGLGWGGIMLNVMSRNNIFHTAGPAAIHDRNLDEYGDYDYDMYNGRIQAQPGYEKNGIRDTPRYQTADRITQQNPTADLSLSKNSPGYDAATILPNFNDDFLDKAPDIGAHESGAPPMTFGVEAFRKYQSTTPPDSR